MTHLDKFEMVNLCETAEELTNALTAIADQETGMIRGRSREFSAKKMAGYVILVVNGELPAELLTREFGIRQQALYLRYCIKNGI